MVELFFNLKGNYLPYQSSFNGTLTYVSALLVGLAHPSPEVIPRQLKGFHAMAESLIFEGRRERSFLRAVKARPNGIPRKKNAVHS